MKAIAVLFDKNFKIKGQVLFEEISKAKTNITIDIKSGSGLNGGLHGIHIHESGDLSEHCASLCNHYNPFNQVHGGPRSKQRHLGDLGNIRSSSQGVVNSKMSHPYLPLRGKHSIIGRSVIIHEDEDDLGRGGNESSLKTGNAGKRILCGVIGYRKNC